MYSTLLTVNITVFLFNLSFTQFRKTVLVFLDSARECHLSKDMRTCLLQVLAHTHACTHTQRQTDRQCIDICTCPHAHTHTAHTHRDRQTDRQMYRHTYMPTCTHTCTHTHTLPSSADPFLSTYPPTAPITKAMM